MSNDRGINRTTNIEEPMTVRTLFEDIEADYGCDGNSGKFESNYKGELLGKGVHILLKHLRALVRSDVLDNVTLTPDQSSLIMHTLYEAVQIKESFASLGGLKTPKCKYRLMPFSYSPLLSAAAYLNSLVPITNTVKTVDNGQEEVKGKVKGALLA